MIGSSGGRASGCEGRWEGVGVGAEGPQVMRW